MSLAVGLSLGQVAQQAAWAQKPHPSYVNDRRSMMRAERFAFAHRTIYRNLSYVAGSHNPNQTLDLILPQTDNAGALPVVLWIHGGGWWGGDKRAVAPVKCLLRAGFAVATINYRLSDEAKFPAQIYDCKAAVRWLRANANTYHLKTDRIGAWGASAGGHLVALLGASNGVPDLEGKGGNPNQSSSVQAVCDWYGPSNLVTLEEQLRQINGQPLVSKMLSELLGGPVHSNLEKAKAASPLTYVSKNSAAFLIVHGDDDHMVPIAQSEELLQALKGKGKSACLFVVKGGRHGFPNDIEPAQMAAAFFQAQIGRPLHKNVVTQQR